MWIWLSGALLPSNKNVQRIRMTIWQNYDRSRAAKKLPVASAYECSRLRAQSRQNSRLTRQHSIRSRQMARLDFDPGQGLLLGGPVVQPRATIHYRFVIGRRAAQDYLFHAGRLTSAIAQRRALPDAALDEPLNLNRTAPC